MPVTSPRATVYAVTCLGAVVLAATMSAATAEPSSPHWAQPRPQAAVGHGHEPLSRVGDDHAVLVVRGGFASREAVRSRLLSSADRSTVVHADAHGTVRISVTPRPGRRGDVLTLVGLGDPADRTAGAGTVTVTVPRFAVVRFAAD